MDVDMEILTTITGQAQISWISKTVSWTFWASTLIKLTISPTVVVRLDALDNRKAWKQKLY